VGWTANLGLHEGALGVASLEHAQDELKPLDIVLDVYRRQVPCAIETIKGRPFDPVERGQRSHENDAEEQYVAKQKEI
jgi:hypothetical protein